MGRPSGAERSSDVCAVCPLCKGQRVAVTIRSMAGAYCRCQDCGFIWHDDEPPAGSAEVGPHVR